MMQTPLAYLRLGNYGRFLATPARGQSGGSVSTPAVRPVGRVDSVARACLPEKESTRWARIAGRDHVSALAGASKWSPTSPGHRYGRSRGK